MSREQATRLVEEQSCGWMNQELELCVSTLCDDVVIVARVGTAGCRVDWAHRRFGGWRGGPVSGRVTDREILRPLFDEANDIAAAQWDSRCVRRGEASTFHGASVVTVDETAVVRIHERRTDKDPALPVLGCS
jgi:hypothetical protein